MTWSILISLPVCKDSSGSPFPLLARGVWWPVTGWSSHACTSIFQQKWVHIWQNTHSHTFWEAQEPAESLQDICPGYRLRPTPPTSLSSLPFFTSFLFFLSVAASSGKNFRHEYMKTLHKYVYIYICLSVSVSVSGSVWVYAWLLRCVCVCVCALRVLVCLW